MQTKKIILVEDDVKKMEDISEFLCRELNITDIVIKESYQSGIKELITKSYDLLLLDMSIPTFTKSPDEPGGPYEKFGGYLILKELARKEKLIQTILITMFDDFGESDASITINQLDSSLKEEFSPHFLGSVFYHAKENKWKEHLRKLILNNSNA